MCHRLIIMRTRRVAGRGWGLWLVGVLTTYLQKALREGKVRTTWTEPDEAYESKVFSLGKQVLAPGPVRSAVEDFVAAGAQAARVTTVETLRTASPAPTRRSSQSMSAWSDSCVAVTI